MKKFLAGALTGLALAAIVVAVLLQFTDLRVTDQSPEQEATDLLLTGQEVARCCGKPPSITVPDLSGATLAEARTTLVEDGLKVRVIRPKPGPTSSNSAVVKQQPSPDALASPGLRVKLYIARG